jgi:hypothetical protein
MKTKILKAKCMCDVDNPCSLHADNDFMSDEHMEELVDVTINWHDYNEGWEIGFMDGRDYDSEFNWKHIFTTFFIAFVLGVAIASPFINSLFN